MERIFKDKQISFFKDGLWGKAVVARSKVMTPLYLERYCGARCETLMSSHDYWEFSAHISGSGLLITETNLQIVPDMIFLIPPGLEHRESSKQDLDTIWLGFKAELPGIKRDKVFALKSPDMIKRILNYWSFSARNHGLIGPELDGLLLTFTGMFFRKLSSKSFTSPMQQAVKFLSEHFQEVVSISDLAEQLNCSEGHFYRQFKDFTGETPVRFLNNIRLKKALFYLQYSELPVNKIASLCGFSDPYYFSRVFTKETNMSPSQYRKSNF